MKNTFNIEGTVMQRLHGEAVRPGRNMSELVEAGLPRVLSEPDPKAGMPLLRLSGWHSGGTRSRRRRS